MAEAELQRKLRVAARTEVELRKRLGERDGRVAQLKEQLAAKQRLLDEIQRRPVRRRLFAGCFPRMLARSLIAAAPSARMVWCMLRCLCYIACLAAFLLPNALFVLLSQASSSARSGSSKLPPTAPSAGPSRQDSGAVPPSLAGDTASESGRSAAGSGGVSDRAALTSRVAQLRIDLAKRDADVARLERALAEAVAAQTGLEKEPSGPPRKRSAHEPPSGEPLPRSASAGSRGSRGPSPSPRLSPRASPADLPAAALSADSASAISSATPAAANSAAALDSAAALLRSLVEGSSAGAKRRLPFGADPSHGQYASLAGVLAGIEAVVDAERKALAAKVAALEAEREDLLIQARAGTMRSHHTLTMFSG